MRGQTYSTIYIRTGSTNVLVLLVTEYNEVYSEFAHVVQMWILGSHAESRNHNNLTRKLTPILLTYELQTLTAN